MYGERQNICMYADIDHRFIILYFTTSRVKNLFLSLDRGEREIELELENVNSQG